MRFNPNNPIDIQRAKERLNFLIEKKKVFDITAKKETKTYPQLKYAHLIMGWFALEYGETLEYIKLEYFKKLVNPEIFEFEFTNRKTGEVRTSYKSCANVSKEELRLAITKFRAYSTKEAGIYLPDATDLVFMQQIEIEINNNQQYL